MRERRVLFGWMLGMLLTASLASAQTTIYPAGSIGGLPDPLPAVSGQNLTNLPVANLLVASQAQGDVLCASSATVWGRLAGAATGNALISGGATTCPSWGKVTLTGHVSGILPVANGGTNNAFFTIAGPASTAKTYTFPNADSTVLTTNALVTSAQIAGGTTVTGTSGFGVTPGTIEAGSVDFAGRVTTGAGGDTGGVITFAGTYSVAPHCVANNESSVAAVNVIATTTTLTFTGVFTAADKITWVCR